MAEPSTQFAQQLRSLREAQGLTVRALANLLGVSKVTVWKWEKGESKPRPRLITPLARALDVPPTQLRLPAAAGSQAAAAVSGLADPTDTGAQGQGESLAEVVARAKRMIAEASGVGPSNITISIEY